MLCHLARRPLSPCIRSLADSGSLSLTSLPASSLASWKLSVGRSLAQPSPGFRKGIRDEGVNVNPGLCEAGDQGSAQPPGSVFPLAAVSSGGRFGVSWAGLALITGSGRLPRLIRLLGTKTRCLAGRKEGSWGGGGVVSGAIRSFPTLPRGRAQEGMGATSALMVSPVRCGVKGG